MVISGFDSNASSGFARCNFGKGNAQPSANVSAKTPAGLPTITRLTLFQKPFVDVMQRKERPRSLGVGRKRGRGGVGYGVIVALPNVAEFRTELLPETATKPKYVAEAIEILGEVTSFQLFPSVEV